MSQACFDNLDVRTEDDETASCASYTTSHRGSMDSLLSNGQGSITGVLSSALTSILTLPLESIEASRMHTNLHVGTGDTVHTIKYRACIGPVDFASLLQRCDGDHQLALQVLQHFCEQGQYHLSAMQKSIEAADNCGLMFHAVT